MSSQHINAVLVEAPSNLGLKALVPNTQPGVYRLPDWLQQHGLHDRLGCPVYKVPAPPYVGELDIETGVRNADAIVTYSQQLAQVINSLISQGQFTLVLGGDCSILLGCLLGLPSDKIYGLFFLDGHTDFAWPGLSQTGGAAGMDLAIATGFGPVKLTNLNGRKPYVQAVNSWSVGNRYENPAYIEAIMTSSIHYWSLNRLRQQGVQAGTDAFLREVSQKKLAGFWIHFDVDVLHNDLMPAVDSPQPGGLVYEELVPSLTTLLDSGKAIGMSITILDPELDPSGRYTGQLINALTPIWNRLKATV